MLQEWWGMSYRLPVTIPKRAAELEKQVAQFVLLERSHTRYAKPKPQNGSVKNINKNKVSQM